MRVSCAALRRHTLSLSVGNPLSAALDAHIRMSNGREKGNEDW
jgi:hypothetical protein